MKRNVILDGEYKTSSCAQSKKKASKTTNVRSTRFKPTSAGSKISKPLVISGSTRIVESSKFFPPTFRIKTHNFDCLNVTEEILNQVLNPVEGDYQLEEKSDEELYNDILAETNFEDRSGENLKLNIPLMRFIKEQDVYRKVARDPTLKLDFFRKIFKSVFFFKKHLVNVSESTEAE